MDASEKTDQQLVAQAQQELPYATQAFEVLLRRYELRVHGTCLRYLNQQQDAEEASQEVFLRVFHSLKKFKGNSSFKTWLFRIAVNTSLTWRDKVARRTKQGPIGDVSDPELLQQIMAEEVATMDQIDGPLAHALASLLVEDRDTLTLRFISELKITEIAEVCEIKESAAKMRVTRALERLKEAYKESKKSL